MVYIARANREAIQQVPRHELANWAFAGRKARHPYLAKCPIRFFKKGADFVQDEATTTARESRVITRRIGSTDFEIAVFFSATNKETLDDKIKRLIKSEAGKKEVKNY